MANSSDLPNAVLVSADQARRSQLAQRMIAASVVALALCLIDWPVAAVWILASSLVRVFQLSALPTPVGRVEPLPWWRNWLGHLGFLLGSAIRGALAVPIWTLGGALRGVLLLLGQPQARPAGLALADPLGIGKISRVLRSSGVFRQPSPPVRAEPLGFVMNGADRTYGPPASGEGFRDHGEDA